MRMYWQDYALLSAWGLCIFLAVVSFFFAAWAAGCAQSPGALIELTPWPTCVTVQQNRSE